MSLTRKYLEAEISHMLGGKQRMYALPNGYKVSMINSPRAHSRPFAWEGAIIDPYGALAYDTPLTSGVEVFSTDDEANFWLGTAFSWAEDTKEKQLEVQNVVKTVLLADTLDEERET